MKRLIKIPLRAAGWTPLVYRQFKKFIAKAVDDISYIDLFYINQCLLKFLVKLKFCVSD